MADDTRPHLDDEHHDDGEGHSLEQLADGAEIPDTSEGLPQDPEEAPDADRS